MKIKIPFPVHPLEIQAISSLKEPGVIVSASLSYDLWLSGGFSDVLLHSATLSLGF